MSDYQATRHVQKNKIILSNSIEGRGFGAGATVLLQLLQAKASFRSAAPTSAFCLIVNFQAEVCKNSHARSAIGDPEQNSVASLADALLLGEQSAIQSCVQFIQSESRGIWHGRARAKMCRRLKHIDLPSHLRSQLVQCITRRLTKGLFSEQFKDQLRLAMVIDSPYIVRAAEQSINSEMAHVARLSNWVIVRHEERVARMARAIQSKQERT